LPKEAGKNARFMGKLEGNAETLRRACLEQRPPVNVPVRLFAAARECAGASQISVELPERSTVADLKRALSELYPALVPMIPSLMIAVSAEYADDSSPIPPGAEVALIPPVSGGCS
jgi:molybdopterin converting factor subunit 1